MEEIDHRMHAPGLSLSLLWITIIHARNPYIPKDCQKQNARKFLAFILWNADKINRTIGKYCGRAFILIPGHTGYKTVHIFYTKPDDSIYWLSADRDWMVHNCCRCCDGDNALFVTACIWLLSPPSICNCFMQLHSTTPKRYISLKNVI